MMTMEYTENFTKLQIKLINWKRFNNFPQEHRVISKKKTGFLLAKLYDDDLAWTITYGTFFLFIFRTHRRKLVSQRLKVDF